ncbi:MAG: hypothetical protein WC848_01245 [Parcubacteria group bacterium]|jgi:hypothetical protein
MADSTNQIDLPEEQSTKSGKIFFLVFGLLIAGSVFATYLRIMVQKNYTIEAQTECDPYTQKCFAWFCDPASDVDGEACTGDPDNDNWYYKLSKRNASKIPLCDPVTDETCQPMLCDPGEKDCEDIYCNEENKIEQEVECSDPEEYTKNNPPEEEDAIDESTETCASDDAECQANETIPSTDETIPPTDEVNTATDSSCTPGDPACQTAPAQPNTTNPEPTVFPAN